MVREEAKVKLESLISLFEDAPRSVESVRAFGGDSNTVTILLSEVTVEVIVRDLRALKRDLE